ncbi:MAG TPA: hypothetical protein VE397_13345 [Stellaceae bacterium]|nr:hypothetical protein [Stellaceae bacterium]
MSLGPQVLLVGAVAVVGVLHTVVPDHWVPITLIARQRGWTKAETARASLQAGAGHVLSTLAIAVVVWVAGVAVADRFGHIVDTAASIALVLFGGWIALSSLRELRGAGGHGHSHVHGRGHRHGHGFGASQRDAVHGPELQRIDTVRGEVTLSIFESGVPPRFRLTGGAIAAARVETIRASGDRHVFLMANHGTYWESTEEIPEPHAFSVKVTLDQGDQGQAYEAHFEEHDHGHGHAHAVEPEHDPLYAPLRGGVEVLSRHMHTHRHGAGPAHNHWHDHIAETAHAVDLDIEATPPEHEHRHKTTARTALLFILGSSPMVEGIPAFFAAGKYGIGLIAVMSLVFASSTIATYVVLCVYSTERLQRVSFGRFERYGEVISGAFIALVGGAFWIWPVL